MKEFFKRLYFFKIKVMFYFILGYGEVAGIVNLVKDVAIILAAVVLIFKVHLGIKVSVLISLGSFLIFTVFGIILKKSGTADYTARMNNSVNPELKLIRKIAEKLKINET